MSVFFIGEKFLAKVKKIIFERFENQFFNQMGVLKRGILFVLVALLFSSPVTVMAQSVQKSTSSVMKSGITSQPVGAKSSGAFQSQKKLQDKTQDVNVAGSDTGKVTISGGTKKLTKAEFLRKIWDYEKSPQQWLFLGERPAVIDFYADWCGPCRIASPILEDVSNQFAGRVDFYKIDTEREQELAAIFNIRGIPAFLYIPKTGKPAITSGIARNREDTRQMFVDNINTLLLLKK
jgi:thioredoxin